MERTWLETIQLLGLDLEAALVLLALALDGLLRLAKAVVGWVGRSRHRRQRAAPTSPIDAWPSQEWGPSR